MAKHKYDDMDYDKGIKGGYSTSHPEKTTSPGVKLGMKYPEGSFKGAGANVKESRAVSGVAPKGGGKRGKGKMKKGYTKAPYM